MLNFARSISKMDNPGDPKTESVFFAENTLKSAGMITTLKIERFKSVRQLELKCRRVNLFIGEPNTGKSNILEALGLLSWLGWPDADLRNFVRFHHTQNLFYDNLTDDPIAIEFHGEPSGNLTVKFEKDRFEFWFGHRQPNRSLGITPQAYQPQPTACADYHGNFPIKHKNPSTAGIKFYRFRALEKYSSGESGALIPPHGANLFSVIYASKGLREWLVELFQPYGLAVVLKPHEHAIELQKQQSGLVIGYPFGMTSDTLQRTLFFHVAVESNKNSVLVFEEPEAHAFPYYTKHLGERIAEDSSNQYFIATHNPYLLLAVLEKATREEVAVCVTSYRDYETRVTALTEDQIGRLLDADPFLGLQAILEAE